MWLEQSQWKAKRKQYSVFLHKLLDKLRENRKNKQKIAVKITPYFGLRQIIKHTGKNNKNTLKNSRHRRVPLLTPVYFEYIILTYSESNYFLQLVLYWKTLYLAQWNCKQTKLAVINILQLSLLLHTELFGQENT